MSQTGIVIIAAVKAAVGQGLAAAFADTPEKLPEERRGEFRELLVPNCKTAGNPRFGDYQCTNAMEIFRFLKANLPKEESPRNPKVVADAIIACIPRADPPLFAELSATGGFVNMRLSAEFISQILGTIAAAPMYTPPPPAYPRYKVAVDFSSPNIAKSMHVGHLRSTIIGDTFARVLEYCGCEVDRINHVGDWGTQFGMLLAFLEDETDGDEIPPISDLVQLYKAAKLRFDADEEFKRRAHLKVVSLQGGGARELAMWRAICDASRAEFQEIYDLLDVRLEEVGESFYNPMLRGVVEDLEALGKVEESDGCKIMFCRNAAAKHPLIVQKSDGGFTYDTTDLAAIRYRIHTLGRDRLIYVTDSGQSAHFELIFEAARDIGWVKHDAETGADSPIVQHIGFGLVCGKDGKKFQTRSGETVKLRDLLDEAVRRARAQLVEHGRDEVFAPEELERVASVVGLGAVKYADLSSIITKNYIFDYDRMLSLKGNTAAYLLYCFARIASIMRKAGVEPDGVDFSDVAVLALAHPAERALALHAARYTEVIRFLADDLLPHRLGEYLYRLAEGFMDFYENCRVIEHDGTLNRTRLMLCACTRGVMRHGLHILGIRTVERM